MQGKRGAGGVSESWKKHKIILDHRSLSLLEQKEMKHITQQAIK